MALENNPVAWLSLCKSGPYKCQYEVSEVNPERPPFNQMWGDWFPVYASPQPEAVITDEMVDRAIAAYMSAPGVGNAHLTNRPLEEQMLAALTAALLPTHKPLQEEG